MLRKLFKSQHVWRKLIMSVVDSLFQMSDEPVRYVGGEIQIIGVPLPA